MTDSSPSDFLELRDNNFGSYNFIDLYTGGGNPKQLIFEDAGEGRLTFPEIRGLSGASLSSTISIAFNSLTIDASIVPGWNTPANMTFYNMPGGFTDPVILRDGADCGASCIAYTSLNAPTVAFQLPGQGTYGIGERP